MLSVKNSFDSEHATAPSVMASGGNDSDKKSNRSDKNDDKESATLVIDYKDVDLLGRYIMETGRLLPARLSGLKAGQQRQLTRAVKRARYLSLLHYCDRHQ